jgi:hypothetical protein
MVFAFMTSACHSLVAEAWLCTYFCTDKNMCIRRGHRLRDYNLCKTEGTDLFMCIFLCKSSDAHFPTAGQNVHFPKAHILRT